MDRNLIDTIQRLDACRPIVSVIGDCMVDEYYDISVSRISPEFPMEIMHSPGSHPVAVLPGGAGNVCAQFSGVGIKPSLFSHLDRRCHEVVQPYCFAGHSSIVAGELNPVKKRFYADEYPFSRWDVELSPEEFARAVDPDYYRKLVIPYSDIAILSDYNKGFFHENNPPSPWIESSGISIVDPKTAPIDRWKSCTIFKPNEKEAASLSGKSRWEDQCDFFQEQLGCEFVVITRGGGGVVGKGEDGHFAFDAPKGVPPRSVIGAGDCFIAFLAWVYYLDRDIRKAVEYAFHAGAAYVKNLHNKPITLHELAKQIDPISAKFIIPNRRDFKLAFTNGCFDLLHAGHLSTIRAAKERADKVVVALNSDESIKRLKGDSRPIIPLSQRATMIASLEFVDFVAIFDEDTPEDLIRKLRPDVVVKGGDYKEEDVVGFGIVPEIRCEPIVEGLSTSAIIAKINAAEY